MTNFEEKSQDMIDYILKKAKSHNFHEIGIQYSDNTTHQLRFYNNKASAAKVWLDETIEIFVATEDGKVSGTNIQDASYDVVDRTLERLDTFLKSAQPVPFYKGITPYEKRDYGDLLRFYDKDIENYSDKAADHVKGAINKALEEGAKKSAGLLEYYDYSIKVANNLGLDVNFKQSSYQFTIRSFLGGEETGQGLSAGRDLSRIEKNLEDAGSQAGKLATLSQGATQGKPGQYNVVFSPTVSANLFGTLFGLANPFYIMLGYSPFKDLIGEQLGPDWLQVKDKGNLPEGPASRPLDFEGNITRETEIVKNGAMMGLMHSYSTSKMMGGEPTGNTVLGDMGGGSKIVVPYQSNIEVSGGDRSFEEILEIDNDNPTIYVTSNWYTRFTSMIETSFSTVPRDAILTVEDGELSNPIKKIRISDNILEMVKRAKAATKSSQLIWWWEVEAPVISPTMLIEDVRVTVAGK